jgi:ribosomal-protein-alanine N-acetyltransferase
MIEINLSPFPELSTPRLLLRQLNQDDAGEIFQLRSDEKANALIDRKTATSIDEARQFIDRIMIFENNNESVMWVITLKDNPKLIGTIVLWHIIKEKDQAEIGYELLPEYRGQGIMKEALSAVIEFGFKTLGLKTIVADSKAINLPSVKLLEKCGFVKVDETGNGYLIYELNH